MRVYFTRKSGNAKTGPIPVSTTESTSCPDACPLRHDNQGGCYAAGGPLALLWRRLDNGEVGLAWNTFVDQVEALPDGTLWRHNQAGDLPGWRDFIDVPALDQLVAANLGKRGFTFTHKPVIGDDRVAKSNAYAVKEANAAGFTINLSADTLTEADELADQGIGPVAAVMDAAATENTTTPAGRKVVICPAIRSERVTCQMCGLCAKADRKSIVGFPAHGSSKRKASKVACAA